MYNPTEDRRPVEGLYYFYAGILIERGQLSKESLLMGNALREISTSDLHQLVTEMRGIIGCASLI